MSKPFNAPVGEEKKERELIKSGNHVATCYSIIDLGTQEGQWEGIPTFKRKIRFTFELPNELRTFNPDKGQQPMVISREFNLSMHENSALRPFIEGWLGQSMSDAEAAKFDINSLCGTSGLLNVIHKVNNGKTYANINTMTPLMDGMPQPQAYNPQVVVHFNDFAEFNWEGFNSLPDFMQKKMQESPEWESLQNWMAKNQKKEQPKQYESDDLPF